ncbi:MAG: hypothetical protein FJX80_06325 [Bacteroidetes bacterium]|nr:hypothetical protein [Bacteroidota bacterium]
MLVASMTDFEALSEVMDDFTRLFKSSQRWIVEYLKERKRLNIPRNQSYLKKFQSKYKHKNLWVTVMYKADEEEKLTDSVGLFSYTWYQTPIGLRVFSFAHGQVSIYNGHLFKRYNERLNLGIGSPLDKVHHFYSNNRVLAPSEFERDGVKTLVGICPLGYILGEQRQDLECSIYKTFIARSTAGPRLADLRQDLLNALDAFQPDQGGPNTTLGPTPDSLKTRLRLALEG